MGYILTVSTPSSAVGSSFLAKKISLVKKEVNSQHYTYIPTTDDLELIHDIAMCQM
jgi:hypothetical protein